VALNVLGISCFYHDAAAALVRDGDVVAAAQEERFSRRKHDPRFPTQAMSYCLEEGRLEADELDAVVFYDNPILSLDRMIKSVLTVAPEGEDQWLKASTSFVGNKLDFTRRLRDNLKSDVPVLFTRHHLSHAASAFYPSPFDGAAVLTVDGVGEWATTSIARGEGESLQILKEIHYPHSLGLLYSAFTYFCGFKVNSGEYKLMGLAPYGEPRYVDRIRERLVAIKPDGSYRLNMDYFGYLTTERMTNERFHQLFDGPPRSPDSRITEREMDLAASVQAVIEELMLGLARHARELTGMKNLCLAGGVALNCVANGLLARERVFDDLWIQPAAGDAGGALGAALLASHRRLGVPRRRLGGGSDGQRGSYLGPAYSSAEVHAYLDLYDYPYELIPDPHERAERIARAIADGKVVGLFSGRMEFGPRALGARSILGDPRRPETQAVMNLKIKYRESFRPFAPAVLEERAGEYFNLDRPSPYMLLVAPVDPARRREAPGRESRSDDLMPVVSQVRSDIPAVTHVDYSARVQTVAKADGSMLRLILEAFERLTGCAALVNTSFNVRGEPIVCRPKDAYRCFMRTEMDLLILEDYVLEKKKQPRAAGADSWQDEFELD